MKRGSQCACCCNNNVNAFLTCTTRSTLVCTRLIIAPLIYSLYFPPWWWLVPPPCLHSLRLGVPLFLSLWRVMQLMGREKKRVWCEVFRHAIGRTHVWGGRGGCDVEIKRTRKRTALVDGAVVAFMPHTIIRICWGINRNMHAYYLLFHERTTIIAAECRALTSNASNACSSVMVCGRSGEKELLFISGRV